MKNKVMVLSVYPAPYRMQLFQEISKEFNLDIFFENSEGDGRNREWFCNNGAQLLDTKEGMQVYKSKCSNLKQYDLVVCYDYSTIEAIKLITLCKILRVPYIINCDGVILTAHGNKIKDWVKSYVIRGASAYFASGKYAKEYFLKYGAREDLIHIHTFSALQEEDILKKIPTDQEKTELRRKLGLPIDKKIAIAVGRFILLKRYDALIKSWKQMSPDVVLLLIGGGPEYDAYKELIVNERLENVILEQFYPKEALLKYYKASDVFVHPTSYDVWGLVVNEAMACGLPVVVSDACVAGLELVEQGQNGYIISRNASDEIIEKTQMILKDECKRKEMAGMALKAIRNYTIENMVTVHRNEISNIINRQLKKELL